MNKPLLLKDMRLPIAIVVLGLFLATIAGLWEQKEIDFIAKAAFEHSFDRVSADVAVRFLKPVFGLNGLKGMYAARSRVSRAEFRDHVTSHNQLKEFPGGGVFGFIERVMRRDMNTFLAAERADGAPLFAIRRFDNQTRKVLYIVKMIEPAANNALAEGLDVGSDVLRREAVEQAINTGETSMTDVISLALEGDMSPAVMLYVPVYSHGSRPATVKARDAALLGVLYTPIVIKKLLDDIPDIVQGNVVVELSTASGNLLYDSGVVAARSTSQIGPAASHLVKSQVLMLAGRAITLRVSSTPRFEAAIDHSSPWLTFAAIASLSTLLALLFWQQSSSRLRAEWRAQQMTAELSLAVNKIGELNHRFSVAVQSNHIGVWDYFIPENKLIWDRQMYALYGVQEQDFPEAYETWQNRLHEDDKARGGDEVREAIQGIKKYDTEFRVVWPTGEVRHIKAVADVLRDDTGNPLRMIGVNFDITLRKKAEEAQIALTRAISLSPVSIIVTDSKANIQYVNARFEEVTGYRLDEIIGENPRILSSHEKSREDYQSMWATLLSGEAWLGEFHNRRKDGTLFWEQAIISPVFNERGVLINYVAIKEDITHLKKITEQLVVAAAELATMEMRERMAIAGDLHDDLGQSLFVAQLKLGALTIENQGNDAIQKDLLVIEALLARSIKSVRSLSTQLCPPVLQQFGLVASLEWLAEELRDNYGLRISLHLGEEAALDVTTAGILFRIVRELLINVSKHSQTSEAEVIMAADTNDGILEITVTDYGVGFDDAQIQTAKGSGLGLFSIKQRCTLLGWRMTIDSIVGEGTIVCIAIPYIGPATMEGND